MPLRMKFAEKMEFVWSLIAEAVYLEYEMMVIGVCSRTDTDLMLYPSRLEIQKDVKKPDFFRNYNTMVVIGDSYEDAVKVCVLSVYPNISILTYPS